MNPITNECFKNKVVMITDDDGIVWYKGFDVASLLGYSNTRNAIHKHVFIHDQQKHDEFETHIQQQGVQKNITFINEKGLRSLICKSKLSKSVDIAKAIGMDINNHKYECKESESCGAIMKAFKGEKMIMQYSVLKYRVDLYFPEYNLLVECDELGHSDRDPKKEKKRYERITKELNCKWLRFNPDDKDFNIFDTINQIFNIIKR